MSGFFKKYTIPKSIVFICCRKKKKKRKEPDRPRSVVLGDDEGPGKATALRVGPHGQLDQPAAAGVHPRSKPRRLEPKRELRLLGLASPLAVGRQQPGRDVREVHQRRRGLGARARARPRHAATCRPGRSPGSRRRESRLFVRLLTAVASALPATAGVTPNAPVPLSFITSINIYIFAAVITIDKNQLQ